MAADLTELKLCKSQSTGRTSVLEFSVFKTSSDFWDRLDGLLSNKTLAPSFRHAFAATKPVPLVVPVIAIVLPLSEGKELKKF